MPACCAGTGQCHLPARLPPTHHRHLQVAPTLVPSGLEFSNGMVGFDKDGREYVITLDHDRATPTPWINVIANPGFGCQVSAEKQTRCQMIMTGLSPTSRSVASIPLTSQISGLRPLDKRI